MLNENSVTWLSITTTSPQKLIKTPTQLTGLMISLRKMRDRIVEKTGAEAIMKLPTPETTVTDPALKKTIYTKSPTKPATTKPGTSRLRGSRILLTAPTTIRVDEATINRRSMSDIGL